MKNTLVVAQKIIYIDIMGIVIHLLTSKKLTSLESKVTVVNILWIFKYLNLTFFSKNQFIVAGSDDGLFYVWDKHTENNLLLLDGDSSIVNCVQPHPSEFLLATSGIDNEVKLWSPLSDVKTINNFYNIMIKIELKYLLQYYRMWITH